MNKEINGYLKFDTDDLMMSMNDAFEGKKVSALSPTNKNDDLNEILASSETDQERRVKAILAEAGKLESIMEEHGEYMKDNDGTMALY